MTILPTQPAELTASVISSPVVRAAHLSGRGSHWKATPISIESRTDMSITNDDVCNLHCEA